MNTHFIADLSLMAEKLPAEHIASKSILITGATGLIGGAVAKLLLLSKVDFTLYVSSRSIESLNSVYSEWISDPRLHFLIIDVTNPISYDINLDYIIDCASHGNPSAFRDTPVNVIKANTIGVMNLVEFGLSKQMTRMVYVSSGEVYGEGYGNNFTEEYSGYVNHSEVRSCYPASKRVAESLCIGYISQYGADICIARPCHIYGPNFSKSDDRAFAQFFKNVLADNDIVLKSKGTQVRSWLYVVDCASAILHILFFGKKGEAYNVSPKIESASILQLATEIANTRNKKIVFDIPKDKDLNAIITRGVLDSSKLHNLGWSEAFSLSEGIRHSVNSINC